MTTASVHRAARATGARRIIPAIRGILAVLLAAAAPPAARLAAQQPMTLTEAIAIAQRQGYAAQTALSTVDGARQRDHALTASYLPSLSLSGNALPSYTRQITGVIQPDGTTQYLPVQETETGLTANLVQRIPWTNSTITVSSGLNQVHVTGINGYDSWSSTPMQIGISQPIFRSNSQAWDLKEQSLRIESAERKYVEAREDVAINTTNAFFDLYAAEADLQNAANNVQINDTLYKVNQGRFNIGKIGENDLLQSQLALLRARSSQQSALLNRDRALARFRVTLHLPAGTPIALAVDATVPSFDADTAEAVRWARANSSAAEDALASRVQAARAVSEARGNGALDGTINASYGFNATGDHASDAYQNLLSAQRFSLSVSLPLWQWGTHGATVAAARDDQDVANANADLAREQLDQDARFAALQLTQARQSLAIAAVADTVAAKRFDVAYNRYVIGKITVDNLYIAQTEKDNALQSFAQALRGYWVAYYTLRRLTLFDFEAGKPIR